MCQPPALLITLIYISLSKKKLTINSLRQYHKINSIIIILQLIWTCQSVTTVMSVMEGTVKPVIGIKKYVEWYFRPAYTDKTGMIIKKLQNDIDFNIITTNWMATVAGIKLSLIVAQLVRASTHT